MSRLSKALHKINLSKVVTQLVVLAEGLLGSGTGDIKKKLVSDIIAAIVRRAKEAGKDVPENYQDIVEALIEQAVAIFNQKGWLEPGADTDANIKVVDAPVPVAAKRGRPAKVKTVPAEELTDEDVALLESLEA